MGLSLNNSLIIMQCLSCGHEMRFVKVPDENIFCEICGSVMIIKGFKDEIKNKMSD